MAKVKVIKFPHGDVMTIRKTRGGVSMEIVKVGHLNKDELPKVGGNRQPAQDYFDFVKGIRENIKKVGDFIALNPTEWKKSAIRAKVQYAREKKDISDWTYSVFVQGEGEGARLIIARKE